MTKEEIKPLTIEDIQKEDETDSKAYLFLKDQVNRYVAFTPRGLNQLPYVLYSAVAMCMQEYLDQETKALKDRIKNLEERTLDQNKTILFINDEKEKLQSRIKELEKENERLRYEVRDLNAQINYHTSK